MSVKLKTLSVKLILVLFFFALFVSCNKNGISKSSLKIVKEFNKASGLGAKAITDDDLVLRAQQWQGKGDYPGVDNWVAVEFQPNIQVLGGLPGQSAFYCITNTLIQSNFDKTTFWKLNQVKPHTIYGYRPKVGFYISNCIIHAAVSQALANSQYGEGGAWQIYIETYATELTYQNELTLNN